MRELQDVEKKTVHLVQKQFSDKLTLLVQSYVIPTIPLKRETPEMAPSPGRPPDDRRQRHEKPPVTAPSHKSTGSYVLPACQVSKNLARTTALERKVEPDSDNCVGISPGGYSHRTPLTFLGNRVLSAPVA